MRCSFAGLLPVRSGRISATEPSPTKRSWNGIDSDRNSRATFDFLFALIFDRYDSLKASIHVEAKIQKNGRKISQDNLQFGLVRCRDHSGGHARICNNNGSLTAVVTTIARGIRP